MTTYRATRNEARVGVGNDFTKDFFRGVEYESGDDPGQVPEYICNYLVSHGILVDARVAEGPMDSPVPPVGPEARPRITPVAHTENKEVPFRAPRNILKDDA